MLIYVHMYNKIILNETEIKNLVLESVRIILSETATSVLYHYLNLEHLEELLKNNRFRTSEPETTLDIDNNGEVKYIDGENLRYLSLTRNGNPFEGFPIIKYGEFGDGETSCICRITIDGDALNKYCNFKDSNGKQQNFKVKPIDWAYNDGGSVEAGYPRDGKNWMMQSDDMTGNDNYHYDKMYSKLDKTIYREPVYTMAYSDTYHHPYSQAEDRLTTTAEYIPNANKYIKCIDIYIRKNRKIDYIQDEISELKPVLGNIKKLAKQRGIPVNIYSNLKKMRKDRITRNK